MSVALQAVTPYSDVELRVLDAAAHVAARLETLPAAFPELPLEGQEAPAIAQALESHRSGVHCPAMGRLALLREQFDKSSPTPVRSAADLCRLAQSLAVPAHSYVHETVAMELAQHVRGLKDADARVRTLACAALNDFLERAIPDAPERWQALTITLRPRPDETTQERRRLSHYLALTNKLEAGATLTLHLPTKRRIGLASSAAAVPLLRFDASVGSSGQGGLRVVLSVPGSNLWEPHVGLLWAQEIESLQLVSNAAYSPLCINERLTPAPSFIEHYARYLGFELKSPDVSHKKDEHLKAIIGKLAMVEPEHPDQSSFLKLRRNKLYGLVLDFKAQGGPTAFELRGVSVDARYRRGKSGGVSRFAVADVMTDYLNGRVRKDLLRELRGNDAIRHLAARA